MPVVSIPFAISSFPKHVSYQLTKEKKTKAGFTDGFVSYAGTAQKWMATVL